MEGETIVNSMERNLIIRFPSITIKDRLKKFFGLPKSIHGEYIDHEQCSWRMLSIGKTQLSFFFIILASNTLLCATVFLEDAVNYQSIAHKVTKKYLLIYRWFSSPMIKK